jgi:hypothetical protein
VKTKMPMTPDRFAVVLALSTLTVGAANAADQSANNDLQVWLNPGIYSQHFDSNKGLRNSNIGFGAELKFAEDHRVMAGTFINSNDARSRYAAYQWLPWHAQWKGLQIGAGVVLGAFDGYPNYRNGAWFVAPVPVLAIEGTTFGVNLTLIPTVTNRFDGALALQFKMRVW